MNLVSTFLTMLLTRMGRWVGSLRASTGAGAPRRAPALMPIPIRADRHARDARSAAEYRRRRGL